MILLKKSEKPSPEQDTLGRNIITKKFLKKLCEHDELFETPNLNKHLYLHYMSFTDIRNLEEYTNLRVLWLENNMIQEIKNLETLTKLRCLYLHHNGISKIENLQSLTELTTLNLSFNHISVIEGLSTLSQLTDLNLSQNSISDSAALIGLSEAPSIKILDLRSNWIQDSEFLLSTLQTLADIKSLYLKGNKCVEDIKYFRKTIIGTLKSVVYLDDKAVNELERISAEAWVLSGEKGEKEARQKYFLEQENLAKGSGDKGEVRAKHQENKRKIEEIRDQQRHLTAENRKKVMDSQFYKIEYIIKDHLEKQRIFLSFPFEQQKNRSLKDLGSLSLSHLEDLLIENEFDFERVQVCLKETYICSIDSLINLWSDYTSIPN